MESKNTEGIVLRCRDYKEADRLVTFFSPDYGKMTGFARLARKSKKRFGPVLEPASILQLSFKEKSGTSLVFLEHATLKKALPEIHRDLQKMAVTWYILELTDLMTVEHDPSPDKYALIRESLLHINDGLVSAWFLSFFEYHLLRITGMEPSLRQCLRCRKSLEGEAKTFCLYRAGGLVCHDCLREGEAFDLVSALDYKTLGTLIPFERESLGESPLMPRRLRGLVHKLFESQLIRPLKTRSFLERWPDLMPR